MSKWTRHWGVILALGFAIALVMIRETRGDPSGPTPGHGWAIRDSIISGGPTEGVTLLWHRARVLGEGADVVASVTETHAQNPNTGLWTYSYVVANASSSPRGIMAFSIEPIPDGATFGAVTGWTVDRSTDGRLVQWFCTDPGPPPAQDDGNVHPSPFDIAPGQADTFAVTTTAAPATQLAKFYVHGFHQWPVSSTWDEVYAQQTSQPSFFQDALTGVITGPGSTVGVSGADLGLRANAFPVPTTSDVSITFTLAKGGRLRLSVYDVSGQLVKVLIDQEVPAGAQSVHWYPRDNNGRSVHAGSYFYEIAMDGEVIGTRKLVIIR